MLEKIDDLGKLSLKAAQQWILMRIYLKRLDAICVFLVPWIGSEHKMMLCQAKRRVVCKTESCTVSGFSVDARSLTLIPHDVRIMQQVITKSGGFDPAKLCARQ